MSSQPSTVGQLQWACRRGMKELDMLLLPFVNQVYPTLSAPQQSCFRQLLTCEDQQLFQWLVSQQAKPDEPFTSLVQTIRTFARDSQTENS